MSDDLDSPVLPEWFAPGIFWTSRFSEAGTISDVKLEVVPDSLGQIHLRMYRDGTKEEILQMTNLHHGFSWLDPDRLPAQGDSMVIEAENYTLISSNSPVDTELGVRACYQFSRDLEKSCMQCKGQGKVHDPITCTECGGAGGYISTYDEWLHCHSCGGDGYIRGNPEICELCEGVGSLDLKLTRFYDILTGLLVAMKEGELASVELVHTNIPAFTGAMVVPLDEDGVFLPDPDHVSFCPFCGEDLESDMPAPRRKCPSCKEEFSVPGEPNFCPFCSASLQEG